MRDEERVDYPCSPTYVTYFASLGMSRDYRPEYYSWQRERAISKDIENLKKEIEYLRRRLEDI